MRMSGLVAALVVASFATLAAQTPAISARKITVVVLEKATFESVVKVLAALSGVAIEFAESVPAELRDRTVERVHFVDTELESALQFITRFNNLTFTVITPTLIRIEPKAAAARH